MADEPLVDISCVEHTYPGGVHIDLCGWPFRVWPGQRVVILGPNGAGKSTLLRHILGILSPTKGTVRVLGVDPARQYADIRGRIGAVMQNVDEQLLGPTVFDDVAFAPLNFGFSRAETVHRVEAILRSLDIYHLRDRLPHYLSGGERKKVALAGALVFSPELLVLDEPLAGIDQASRREISRYLQALHRETGMTMISTAHDMDVVAELADIGYIMAQGGTLALSAPIMSIFFDHDLDAYNLAPPTVARVIHLLAAQGVSLEPTLDVDTLVRELMARLQPR